jgi:hypothetical protein
MPVRLSTRMEQFGSHRTDFHEIWYLSIFWKSVKKIEVSLNSNKSNEYFARRPIYIFDHISTRFFLEREMLQTKVVERIKIHILWSVTFFKKSCHLWDDVENYCRAGQTTDDNMVHARCTLVTLGYKHVYWEYVIVIAFPWQRWLLKCISVLRLHVCCLSCCKECRFFRVECLLVTFVFWKILHLNVMYFLITASNRESKF